MTLLEETHRVYIPKLIESLDNAYKYTEVAVAANQTVWKKHTQTHTQYIKTIEISKINNYTADITEDSERINLRLDYSKLHSCKHDYRGSYSCKQTMRSS